MDDKAKMLEDAEAVWEWLRKPDWDEKFGTKEILDWIEKRPCSAMYRLRVGLGGKP